MPRDIQKKREYDKKYHQSEKWKEYDRKYHHSEKSKKRDREHKRSTEGKAQTRRYRQTLDGRIQHLFNGARQRAKRHNIPFTITREILRQKLIECNNKCEITGGTLDYSFRNDVHQNPFAPSLDQRIPRAGYTPENTQIVACWYNRMKGDLTDGEAKIILKNIVFCEQQIGANI